MLKTSNRNERLIQNLKDAGCDKNIINDFIELLNNKDLNNIFSLLRKYREELLEIVHKKQKEIDILDYLILDLKNNKV